jgi:hypothetical protein
VNGQEQVQTYNVYYLAQGPTEAYTADADTQLLLHMDETTGSTLADSSSFMNDQTLDSSLNGAQPGVFSNGLYSSSVFYTSMGTFAGLMNLGQWTIEGWVNISPSASYLYAWQVLDGANQSQEISLYFQSSQFQLALPGGGENSIISAQGLNDGVFHHIAEIADSQNQYRNFLFVVDGNVVYSKKVKPESITPTGNANWLRIQTYQNSGVDELRISKKARYTLNYSSSRKAMSSFSKLENWLRHFKASWLPNLF